MNIVTALWLFALILGDLVSSFAYWECCCFDPPSSESYGSFLCKAPVLLADVLLFYPIAPQGDGKVRAESSGYKLGDTEIQREQRDHSI